MKNRKPELIWSATRASILLTVIAVLLWSFSILNAKLEIGFFGLIGSFPLTFFEALGILTVASTLLWISKEDHGKLLFFQLSILIISLWLIPLLIGASQPVAPHLYEKFGENVYPLVHNGFLNPQLVWYHNWPGVWIAGTSLLEMLGLDSSSGMIMITPFILQFLFALILFVFLRNTLGKGQNNYYWAGIWIFQLANWLEQSYFGPAAYALLLVIIVLAILTKRSSFPTGNGVSGQVRFGYSICLILIFACLTITHLLSAVVALFMIALLYIANRKSVSLTLIVILAVFIASWTIYDTVSILKDNLPGLVDRAFRLDLVVNKDIFSMGLSGSLSHQTVSRTKILISAVLSVTALIGIVLGRITKRNIPGDNMVLAVGAGGVLGFFAGFYSWELTQRTWYFLLPVIAYFGLKLLRHKVFFTVAICIILLACLPLHFISHYGNQKWDYLDSANAAGLDFGINIQEEVHYPIFNIYKSTTEGHKLVLPEPPPSNHYFPISQNIFVWYDFRYNSGALIDQVWSRLDSSPNYDSIYANPEFNLYLYEIQ